MLNAVTPRRKTAPKPPKNAITNKSHAGRLLRLVFNIPVKKTVSIVNLQTARHPRENSGTEGSEQAGMAARVYGHRSFKGSQGMTTQKNDNRRQPGRQRDNLTLQHFLQRLVKLS